MLKEAVPSSDSLREMFLSLMTSLSLACSQPQATRSPLDAEREVQVEVHVCRELVAQKLMRANDGLEVASRLGAEYDALKARQIVQTGQAKTDRPDEAKPLTPEEEARLAQLEPLFASDDSATWAQNAVLFEAEQQCK